MIELDKMTLAEIVQNNGGKITADDLNAKLVGMGATKEAATSAVSTFTQCHLVNFDGTTISFAD